MKKLLNIILVLALAMPMIAGERLTPEERANADYSSWLPQQGEYSLGFNIDPVTTFIGNFFNGTVGNALAPLAGEPIMRMPGMVSIMGSYMLTDKVGVRANIGLGLAGGTNRGYVIDDAEKFINPYSTLEGQDKQKWLNAGASFSAGIEYRVGKRRIQGVFGAGLTYGFWGINRNQYTYYNVITAANQNPSNAGLYGGAPNAKFATDYSYIDNPRLLDKHTAAGTHILGVYGTVGVEWFVAPKIALGLNVNVLLDYNWDPERVEVWEGWNHFTQEVNKITIHDQARNSGFQFTTDNIGANLYVSFYFGK